jgi:probable rRNA maturation factor
MKAANLAAAVIVQRQVPAKGIPAARSLQHWAAAARAAEHQAAVITLRIVDAAEGQSLNRDWRGKDYATNVLSFPFEEPDYLGDIILCAPVIAREAAEQGKSLRAHWAHLVIHGVLHLQGYDHTEDAEAEAMEQQERELLAGLGFPDPYAAQPLN